MVDGGRWPDGGGSSINEFLVKQENVFGIFFFAN